MITILRGAAFVAAMALAGLPAIAPAATAYQSSETVHANYSASISPSFGFGYPWTGTLQLAIHPDGIINGYYRPADNAAFIPVTGGRDGQNVWIDIGDRGRLHVSGTFQNGAIVGTAFDQRSMRQYKFNAQLTS